MDGNHGDEFEVRPDPRVRPATVDDAGEVIRLAALMYEAMGVDASDQAWRQAGSAAISNRLDGDTAVFVADDPTAAGRLAASGAGTIARRLPGPGNPGAGVGYIQWVSTDVAWRHRGLARGIMVSLLGWYEERDIPTIELHATRDGEALYRSLGFQEGDNLALRRRRVIGLSRRAGDSP